MMELRHLAMVNWHLFDVEDIEVGGHIGVLGENRSGKSTILDMAQVVLTGGSRHFQRLNAVAGDGRGRTSSKRSVVGYCLGMLGDDQRRRDEARTYIALGFVDSEGARPPVSIGLALEARKSETNETVLGRFVVVGRILTTQDFIEARQGRRYPAQWDEVRARIIAAVGADNFVNHRDRASDYVREYMRHLLRHLPYGEQNAAALLKAVVNAMTLGHNQTATEFVRELILERNPIRVGDLRESILTYRNINAIIQKMRAKLEALKALRSALTSLGAALDRRQLAQWLAKRADWLTARAESREITSKLGVEIGGREAARHELAFLDEELKGIEAEIQRLIVAIAEHDAKTGRQSLAQARRSAAQNVARAESDFRKRVEAIARLRPLAALRGHGFDELSSAIVRLYEAAQRASVGVLPDGLAAAEAGLLQAAPALLGRVNEARHKLIRDAAEMQERAARLGEKIRLHASGQSAAYLEESTELLCRRLRQHGMAPRVLCELIEIADPAWTAAAEALLGRDREAVFVDRADIAVATAIFKEGRRDFPRALLVSLTKLEQFRAPPAPGTFASIFRSDDVDALSFIMRRHGAVRLAHTLAEFDLPGRAIMTDGLYDDGLVRAHRFVPPRDYKIGKSAQVNLVRLMDEELAELRERLAKAQNLMGGGGRRPSGPAVSCRSRWPRRSGGNLRCLCGGNSRAARGRAPHRDARQRRRRRIARPPRRTDEAQARAQRRARPAAEDLQRP
jgi:hypothetical protein